MYDSLSVLFKRYATFEFSPATQVQKDYLN